MSAASASVASAFRRNLAALIAAAPLAFAQPSLSVKDVMKRVETYVASYGEKASIVVCSERYAQDASGPKRETRTLVSDFAIVKAEALHGWLGFRDVLEVDGRALPDRQDRLVRVLVGSQGRYDEATRLFEESARYNIGFLARDFNIPTAALFFFVPQNHDRFKYAARRVGDDGTWEIAFREVSRPTLIRTPDGESIPSSGTLWVRPEDGVVVRTVLEADMHEARLRRPQAGTVHIDVTFQPNAALGMWLPATMDERLNGRRAGEWQTVTGHAEYSNCRQFTTEARIR